jgi:hypothetical protein
VSGRCWWISRRIRSGTRSFAASKDRRGEGETLKVFIQPVGGKGMTFRPRVLRAVPDQELRWLGRVVLPGIFDGEHFFKIEPLDQGRRTRFIQGERFTGLLVPLLRKNLDRGTRAGFEAMNQALKARVEESSSRR